jgi:hypothetical protein
MREPDVRPNFKVAHYQQFPLPLQHHGNVLTFLLGTADPSARRLGHCYTTHHAYLSPLPSVRGN